MSGEMPNKLVSKEEGWVNEEAKTNMIASAVEYGVKYGRDEAIMRLSEIKEMEEDERNLDIRCEAKTLEAVIEVLETS